MIFVVTIIFIVLLVFIIIAYMLYSDYQVQQELDKKLVISKQKNIIDETDELLLNVTQIPYSYRMVAILQKRIFIALQPTNMAIKQRITDISAQIKQTQTNPSKEGVFQPPQNTDQALKMIRVMRRLRKIIRIEFNRGRVSKNELVDEDKVLEVNIYKIQFNNLLHHIDEANMNSQFGTSRDLIMGGLNSLNRMQNLDPWLQSVKQHLEEMLNNLNKEVEEKHAEELASEKAKEKDDIDLLFQPKKKW